MENTLATLAIGFMAQVFFSARILVQWILSERARQVLSPSVFWVLSLGGSYLLCLYGWLRNDFAIVLGQALSYYIYLWNLKMKGVWPRVPIVLRWVLVATPVMVAAMLSGNAAEYAGRFLHNADVPTWMLIFGSAGQVLFTLRFVYQWLYSKQRHSSQLPAGFWMLSLTGALLIVAYGIMRNDVVLIVGQSFGLVAYTRNLYILRNEKKRV